MDIVEQLWYGLIIFLIASFLFTVMFLTYDYNMAELETKKELGTMLLNIAREWLNR